MFIFEVTIQKKVRLADYSEGRQKGGLIQADYSNERKGGKGVVICRMTTYEKGKCDHLQVWTCKEVRSCAD